MKAKTLIPSAIIAAAALYFIVDASSTSRANKPGDPLSETTLPEPESSPMASNKGSGTKETNNTPLNHSTLDRDAIMRISEKLEYCRQEENQYRVLSQQSLPALFESLSNETSSNAYEQALTYLVQQKLVRHQDAVEYFEHFQRKQLQQQYRIISTAGSTQNPISLDDYAHFMRQINQLDTALQSHTPQALQAWLQQADDRLSDTFVVPSDNSTDYVSSKSVILSQFSSLHANLQTWVLNNLQFSAFDLHLALKNGLPAEFAERVLQAVVNPEQPFPGENGKITDLLGSALQYGDSALTEQIIRNGFYSNPALATPVVNQYLERLITAGIVTQEDRNKISLLAANQFSPTTLYNSRIRAEELVGYQNQGITPSILSPLLNNELTLEKASRALLSQSEQLALNNQFLDNAAQLKALQEKRQKTKQQCAPLKQQQIALEPAFGDIRDYTQLVADLQGNTEKLALLSETSPVLYDLLAWELINAAPEQDLRAIKQQLATLITKHQHLNQALQLGDSAMPHQQSYLASQICHTFHSNGLLQAFERNWYIDLTHNAFNLCRREIRDFNDFEQQYQTSMSKPVGRVYSLIKNMNYADAITLLETNQNTQGLPKGRDALALLLDRMVPFRASVKDNMFTLLERLLANTELTQQHLSRLNRLELKYPSYYAALSSQYPQLKNARTVAPNRYISFL